MMTVKISRVNHSQLVVLEFGTVKNVEVFCFLNFFTAVYYSSASSKSLILPKFLSSTCIGYIMLVRSTLE